MTKNNYRRLGDYIKKVDVRNTEDLDIPLMGLSIQKCFISSIANTIGTNMKTYKIIERDQFAYGPVTSRNGDKITIALFDDYDRAIISQAYIPFKIKDKEKLLPKYLMMWFSRPEFDRYARFKSHGSARETFDWEEMCDVELPIPSIEKQREIVADYQAVENKIKTNEAICEKLEETAQTIYRRWFEEDVDLDGLPEGRCYGKISDIIQFKNGKSKPKTQGIYPVYGGNGIIGFVDDFNNENVVVIGRVGAYCGSLYREKGKCWVSDNAISARSKIGSNMFSLYLLQGLKLNEKSEGTGQPLITQGMLNEININIPEIEMILKFENVASSIFNHQDLLYLENQQLHQLQSLLLGRMTLKEMEVKY